MNGTLERVAVERRVGNISLLLCKVLGGAVVYMLWDETFDGWGKPLIDYLKKYDEEYELIEGIQSEEEAQNIIANKNLKSPIIMKLKRD